MTLFGQKIIYLGQVKDALQKLYMYYVMECYKLQFEDNNKLSKRHIDEIRNILVMYLVLRF